MVYYGIIQQGQCTVNADIAVQMLTEAPKYQPEYNGRTFKFENVSVQWDRSSWQFKQPDPEQPPISIDTYSIWNPAYHDEIAQRLARGEHCAMYIMGNFGIGAIREAPEWQGKRPVDNRIFTTIKQRPEFLSIVTFIHPEDAINIIELDRLAPAMRHLRWADARLKTYAGPQHNIFPFKDNGMTDGGMVRTEENGDKTVACFWIPGHPGYEGIYDKVRKHAKHGIFGGGSLNIHGQEPCYTTEQLHSEMVRLPEWQTSVDFIIFDEIAEAAGIGRSQTMVSFTGETPQLVRIGSLSPEYISDKTGYKIRYSKEDIERGKIRKASSLTPYNEVRNRKSEMSVERGLAQMERFQEYKIKNSWMFR